MKTLIEKMAIMLAMIFLGNALYAQKIVINNGDTTISVDIQAIKDANKAFDTLSMSISTIIIDGDTIKSLKVNIDTTLLNSGINEKTKEELRKSLHKVLDDSSKFEGNMVITKDNGDEVSVHSNSLEQFIDEVFSAFEDLSNQNENEHKCKYETRKPTLVDVSAWFGYGYLGWGKDIPGFASMPRNDYSLRWSHDWTIGVNVSLFPDNKVYFSTGLWYESMIFKFDDGFSLGEFSALGNSPNASNKRQKLVARYIELPLFVNWKFARDWSISAGVIGGLNFRTSHTGYKRHFDLDDNHIEESMGSNFSDFNPAKVDAMIRIGYEDISLFVKQSLTNIFKSNKEMELYPFTIGLSIGW